MPVLHHASLQTPASTARPINKPSSMPAICMLDNKKPMCNNVTHNVTLNVTLNAWLSTGEAVGNLPICLTTPAPTARMQKAEKFFKFAGLL